MPNIFHDTYIGHNNHAVTANPDDASYADIATRDADSSFNTNSSNLNKIVRVESPLSFYILTSITPTWLEFSRMELDTLAELLVFGNTTGGTNLLVSPGDELQVANIATIGSLTSPPTDVSLFLSDPTKAFVVNSGTQAQRDAITPSEGMQYHNTDVHDLEFFNGTAWQSVDGGGGDVVGPASSVVDSVPTFSTIIGKNIQDPNTMFIVPGQVNIVGDLTIQTDGNLGFGNNFFTQDIVLGAILQLVDPDFTIVFDNKASLNQLGTSSTVGILAKNEISGQDVIGNTRVYGALTTNIEDNSSGNYTGSMQLHVAVQGNPILQPIIGANTNQQKEVFIYDNIRFNNLSTGTDPILTANASDQTLSLTGNLDLGTNDIRFTDGSKISSASDIFELFSEDSFSFRTNATTFFTVQLHSARNTVGTFGHLDFIAKDVGGTDTIYASIDGLIVDPANGVETGAMRVGITQNGTKDVPVVGFNELDRLETLIHNDLQIKNQGTGGDPVFSSNNATRPELGLAGDLSITGNSPVLTLKPVGDFQQANIDLMGSRDQGGIDLAQLSVFNLRSGSQVEVARISFFPAAVGTSSGEISLFTKTETGSLTERMRINDGQVSMEVPVDMTGTNKIINMADPTLVQDAATKSYVDSFASSSIVYVQSLADLPTPVTNVITLADSTVYQILNSIDLAGNRLIFGVGTEIIGVAAPLITLSGSTTVPLIESSSTDGVRFKSITVQQNGTGDLMRITAPGVLSIFDGSVFNSADIGLVAGLILFIFNCDFNNLNIVQDATGGMDDILIDAGTRFLDAGIILKSGSTTSRLIINSSVLSGSTPTTKNIIVEGGANIRNITVRGGIVRPLDVGAAILVVENPDDVELGSIINTDLAGPGKLFVCEPVSSSNFAAVNIDVRDVGFDGTNLLSSNDLTARLHKHTGISAAITSTIISPGITPTGVTWARGNLVSVNGDLGNETIFIHSGFSTTITDSFASPGTVPVGITFDGTNLISIDDVAGVFVHDGLTSTILSNFASPASTSSGISFDGVNLLIADSFNNVIYVMKGISSVVQYTFTGPGTFVDGITITDVGIVIPDSNTGTMFVYNHPVTFDHSSATWEVQNNSGGIIESSDRGGSQYEGASVAITVVQSAWTDIANSGTIFYGSFTVMEKCRLNNEQNGEIAWTGVRNRGRSLTAQTVVTRSTGGATDIFYELAIVINGVVQKDSKGVGILPTNNSFVTLQTIPITRDLVAGDTIKLQIRNTTNAVSPDVSISKFSIN